jgi:hypothetical protein
VELALGLARQLRHLAESATWQPLSGPETVRSALEPLGLEAGTPSGTGWDAWKRRATRVGE